MKILIFLFNVAQSKDVITAFCDDMNLHSPWRKGCKLRKLCILFTYRICCWEISRNFVGLFSVDRGGGGDFPWVRYLPGEFYSLNVSRRGGGGEGISWNDYLNSQKSN